MGAPAVIMAIGTVVSAAGAYKQAQASKAAEKAREKQMNLDVQRKKREAIRQALVARSTALANATAQGAASGSGLQGGYGQIGGDLGRNLVGLNQDQQLGSQVFAANRAYATGGMMAGFGSAISNSSEAGGKIYNTLSKVN